MKTLRLILMLFILPVCALAQGAQYTGVAQTARNMIGMGNVYVPIPGASVNVCTGVYTGTACPSGGNVTVYSNQALTTVLTQPLTADNYGNFTFWAAPGAYYFTVTGQGAASSSYQLTLPFGISGTYNATAKSIEQVRYADQFSGADISAKVAAATTDINPSGGAGGAIFIAPGYYSYANPIVLTSDVRIAGLGRRSTILTYTGSGCAVETANFGNGGTNETGLTFSGIENVRIALTNPSAKAICIESGNTSGSDVRWNTFRDIEIAGASSSSQVGIVSNTINSGVAINNDNEWDRITTYQVGTGIERSNEEGNVWRDIQIDSPAGSNSQIVDTGIHDDYTQARVAGSASSAVTGTPFDSYYNLVSDIGTSPALNLSGGSGNTFRISLIGNTPLGMVPGGNSSWDSKNGFSVAPAANGSVLTQYGNNSSYLLRSFLAASDANPAFDISQPGTLQWGAGGASSSDVSLYRDAATSLTDSGAFNVTGLLNLNGGGSIASGKTLTNNGTISGGTVNPTTLQQGGAAVALASQLPLSGSVAGSTTSLAANTCGDVVTQTVTGATTTMTPIVTVSGALPTSGLVIQSAVTATNTVSIEYCNVTTAPITPAAATLEIRVVP